MPCQDSTRDRRDTRAVTRDRQDIRYGNEMKQKMLEEKLKNEYAGWKVRARKTGGSWKSATFMLHLSFMSALILSVLMRIHLLVCLLWKLNPEVSESVERLILFSSSRRLVGHALMRVRLMLKFADFRQNPKAH